MGDGVKELSETEVMKLEHQITQEQCPGDEQQCLDDLHPGGGQHAAEDDINEHQHSNTDHRRREIEADEPLDDDTGTDHLRNHVESGNGERAE